MTFTEYQLKSRGTAIYPEAGKNITYPVLGLVGEAGEIANKVKKKIYRDDGGNCHKSDDKALKRRIGRRHLVSVASRYGTQPQPR